MVYIYDPSCEGRPFFRYPVPDVGDSMNGPGRIAALPLANTVRARAAFIVSRVRAFHKCPGTKADPRHRSMEI